MFGADAKAIAEEVDLLMMCLEDGEDYLRITRKGMRVALTRELREHIWNVFIGCNAQVNLDDQVRIRDLTDD